MRVHFDEHNRSVFLSFTPNSVVIEFEGMNGGRVQDMLNSLHTTKPAYTRGAGKYLARPGRKQATATEDFDVHISYL